MINKAYISLGSNVGRREELLFQALSRMENSPSIEVERKSSIYETEPVGLMEQPSFLNMVASVRTILSPFELLHFLQKIENELGRKRVIKWGPRTIDLDILLYNDENIKSETLTIPHPHMFEREFVMIPLKEIYPTIIQDYKIDNYPSERGVWLWKQSIGAEELERSGSLKDSHKKV